MPNRAPKSQRVLAARNVCARAPGGRAYQDALRYPQSRHSHGPDLVIVASPINRPVEVRIGEQYDNDPHNRWSSGKATGRASGNPDRF